jgi:XapX domain-containing protein
MKILIAFMVAFGIGAASRWTGVPSLAPQAIVGALLIVAMSTGYVSADRFLKRNPSPSVTVSISTNTSDERGASGQVAASGLPVNPDSETDIAFWRQKSEDLQLIIADLISANQQLRASRGLHNSEDSGVSANSHLDLLN